MNHQGTKTLHTSRFLLRPYKQGDAQQMYTNFLSDPKVSAHVSWAAHTSIEATNHFLQMHLEKYTSDVSFYGWAIEMNGDVIGSIGAFDINEEVQACEIGYSLGSRYWGQGIATEAVQAVLQFLFHSVGFNRVTASYNAENLASGRVMQKAGMQYEGTCRQATLKKDGSFGNLILYSILKNEYSSQ